MQGIETKDYILLALTVPAGLLTIWLAQTLSKFTDFGSKKIRLGRLKSEQTKFLRVTDLKQSGLINPYVTLECTYAAVQIIIGFLIIIVSFFVLIIDTALEIKNSLSFVSNTMTFLIGAIAIVSGWRKYKLVYGDYLRLKNYENYKNSVDKLTQGLSTKSKTS